MMNVLFGKRHLLLAVLAVTLGVAVYLNWEFSRQDTDLAVGTSISAASSEKTYGEAKYVSGDSEKVLVAEEEGFFEEARFARQAARDEAVESLQKIMSSALTAQEQESTMMTAANITDAIEAEANIESLVKAKGFEDCLAIINDDKASIVVKTEGLQDSEAAQITDIVLSQTNLTAKNIQIVEVK